MESDKLIEGKSRTIDHDQGLSETLKSDDFIALSASFDTKQRF